jgi:hypothetical protein
MNGTMPAGSGQLTTAEPRQRESCELGFYKKSFRGRHDIGNSNRVLHGVGGQGSSKVCLIDSACPYIRVIAEGFILHLLMFGLCSIGVANDILLRWPVNVYRDT